MPQAGPSALARYKTLSLNSSFDIVLGCGLQVWVYSVCSPAFVHSVSISSLMLPVAIGSNGPSTPSLRISPAHTWNSYTLIVHTLARSLELRFHWVACRGQGWRRQVGAWGCVRGGLSLGILHSLSELDAALAAFAASQFSRIKLAPTYSPRMS